MHECEPPKHGRAGQQWYCICGKQWYAYDPDENGYTNGVIEWEELW